MNRNRNKINIYIAIITVLLICLFIVLYPRNRFRIQQKLIGSWNIEYDNSYIYRDTVSRFLSMIIDIKRNKIILPTTRLDYDTTTINLQDKLVFEKDSIIKNPINIDSMYDLLYNEGKGNWKIISINPDSIYIDVPKNPLNGKYALKFFIDRNGYHNMRNNIYKIKLQNDSTLIICNKGGFVRYDANWERN